MILIKNNYWVFIEWNNNLHLKYTHIILPPHSFPYLLSPLLPFPSLILSSHLFYSFHFSSHLISSHLISSHLNSNLISPFHFTLILSNILTSRSYCLFCGLCRAPPLAKVLSFNVRTSLWATFIRPQSTANWRNLQACTYITLWKRRSISTDNKDTSFQHKNRGERAMKILLSVFKCVLNFQRESMLWKCIVI